MGDKGLRFFLVFVQKKLYQASKYSVSPVKTLCFEQKEMNTMISQEAHMALRNQLQQQEHLGIGKDFA